MVVRCLDSNDTRGQSGGQSGTVEICRIRWLRLSQDAYYRALAESTRASDSAVFVGFMLDRLLEAIAVASASKTPVKRRVQTPVKTGEQLLLLLRRQPTLTLAEVATLLNKSTSAIERTARKLRDAGRLHHVGPQKGVHWEVIA
jgi:Fic family protein